MTTPTSTESLTVRTTGGAVRGVERDGIRRWLGVPYAEPPVGELRWRAPRRVRPWEGVRPAVAPGPAGPQRPHPYTGGIARRFPQSEDCLYVTVTSPTDADGLPVLVFVHGGAYRSGSGGTPDYDGGALARLGVVLVTVSYRLGVFGSMDLRVLGGDGVTFDANCTLRDQIAALGWVAENVAGFGGDPARITVFGESSGGNSVTTLLAAPSARPVLAGAIAQSAHPMTAHSPENKAEHARMLARRLGLDPAHAGRAMRVMPVSRLRTVAEEVDDAVTRESPLVAVMSPTIDGDVLPEHPLAAARAGRTAPVPLVIGTNHDEASLFKHARTPILPNTRERVERLVAGTDPEAWQRIRRLYADDADRPRRDWVAAGGDGVFHVPSIDMAEAHAAAGNPTWMYRFDHASPLMRLVGLGAAHGTELPYLFGTFRTPLGRIVAGTDTPATRRRIHEVLAGSWTAFARDGVPSHRGWTWPRYTAQDRETLCIDRVSHVERDPDRAVREAWSGVHYEF
ncbi:carboxylesterase/lipase family protein [Curtobacterium sp. MCBD17_040]|uniref:carboxylesterase/lipase family protein n=1 Tax=Curtobacterium sp. MCBD17_040 TaxID=2175674 RepID=UPI000DA97A74|nr:carboxylesterase/lipase family protein [Curtobacterium sp. MCBD17_040]WIB63180.1 carboxylesterase/lipase family protein [Curtobacterium sp. MCBD17_040]